MSVQVKICGLSSPDTVDCAVRAGAAMCGFVFFDASPRYVTAEQAAELVRRVPASVRRVGLFVDAKDDFLGRLLDRVELDLLQLHGAESVDRVAQIRREFGLPVMKVLAVSKADDLEAARAYEAVADHLLFDAQPPEDATRPGGNARAFDWRLLSGRRWGVPWLLAGGLTSDNLRRAVRQSGASFVDVSSGVESRPGKKDPAAIQAFLQAAKRLEANPS